MSLKSYIYKNKKHPSENSLSLSRFTSSCLLLKPQTFYNKIFKNSDIVVFMTPPSPISNYIVFLMTPPPLKRSDVFYGRPPRRHTISSLNLMENDDTFFRPTLCYLDDNRLPSRHLRMKLKEGFCIYFFHPRTRSVLKQNNWVMFY